MSKPREVLGPPVSAGFGAPPKIETESTPSFASEDAADLWVTNGRPELGEPSGKTGYTVADVRSAGKED